MFKKYNIYIYIYVRFNTISFEIVTLHNNTSISAFLPLLESGLESVFCKQVENLERFALDLSNDIKTATFEQYFQIGEGMEVCRW